MARNMKNVWYLYQARRVATQANVAGGAIKIDVTLATGQVARIVAIQFANSGTNSCAIVMNDEDDALQARLASVASGAAAQVCIPSIGTAPTSSANSVQSNNMLMGPGSNLAMEQSVAGAQNDTLTLSVVLLLSTNTAPTWAKDRSTNEADVTLAASTISAANTLQAVVL